MLNRRHSEMAAGTTDVRLSQFAVMARSAALGFRTNLPRFCTDREKVNFLAWGFANLIFLPT